MKRILIVTLLFLLCNSVFAQNVYLLSVGISDYPGTQNDLVLPVNDAKAILDLYKANSFATTKILINEQATRAGIIEAAESLYKNANAEDIIVFFFSGHGHPFGFVAYDAFLDYEDIKGVFSSCKSKHKMIFADACFSGKLRDPGSKNSEVKPNIDVLLFLSSRHNEVSIESPGMKNGFFTACLVKCLKGGADVNRDRIISAKELYDSVRKGVVRLSHDKQHPVMWGSFDDNMVVMKWK